ncbi:metallophosphoesterase [Nesterenkonia xinjiangensis]|uniref:3',5'-cyclic AMP phosphodiesterase CpdA n=1 Tax=Nesterenkonia xinjiangensis TaxID=225327 RepID=A0A7Z0K8Q1_9MICC|nr:metallophosphoesterase [Nesterenkonia xinjiangensis]NYJ77899.1 3',5'-cyclic AMP phosphodiesterase CpdA [Nesterenkonia xinjiangensis]
MSLRAAEYPHPHHTLVHLSDTHFVTPGELLSGTGHPRDRLKEILTSLVAAEIRPAALIITGDLADRGEASAYRELRSVLTPAAEQMGTEIAWVMGNHDHRETVRRELLDAPASDAPYDTTVMIGGLRLIILDSTVPGKHHGELSEEQLVWLAEVLREPAPEGSILAMHHPPLPCVQDLAVTVELREQQLLAEVVRGTDLRAILAGHLHYSTTATFAGIPVSVAGATSCTQDLFTPRRGTRARDAAQGLNLVHVYDHTIMHTVVPMAGGVTVGRDVDAAGTARLLAEDEVYIPSRAR